jgi:hypothetical protein
MVGGSLQVLWLPPPLKLVAMNLIKKKIRQSGIYNYFESMFDLF